MRKSRQVPLCLVILVASGMLAACNAPQRSDDRAARELCTRADYELYALPPPLDLSNGPGYDLLAERIACEDIEPIGRLPNAPDEPIPTKWARVSVRGCKATRELLRVRGGTSACRPGLQGWISMINSADRLQDVPTMEPPVPDRLRAILCNRDLEPMVFNLPPLTLEGPGLREVAKASCRDLVSIGRLPLFEIALGKEDRRIPPWAQVSRGNGVVGWVDVASDTGLEHERLVARLLERLPVVEFPFPEASKPDFSVPRAVSSLESGQPCAVRGVQLLDSLSSVIVTNLGPGAAPPQLDLRMELPDSEPVLRSISAHFLRPFQPYEEFHLVAGLSGSHSVAEVDLEGVDGLGRRLTVTVDPENHVAEVDESNNRLHVELAPRRFTCR